VGRRRCELCGEEDGRILLRHHTSYSPSETTMLCGNCHVRVHRQWNRLWMPPRGGHPALTDRQRRLLEFYIETGLRLQGFSQFKSKRLKYLAAIYGDLKLLVRALEKMGRDGLLKLM